ncbi:hypothetical protein DYB25_000731 [Aphanomyces astaci]|uniref:Peptidase M1 membrane alanine aminopeptidase domain-containing protein n=2 Tax=Aphanomyces astaci TaxID=112090 RepID=A0A397BLQ7_APHAT|nr:hypothetical protein DYB25_000731 [Aphanomyces astaci]RHY69570.1 hypothetical protein DYB30_007319 [Aphanomyces astaci]RHZ30300.1 hypothetical protein DYB26_003574 [Aphanomyces astaci]
MVDVLCNAPLFELIQAFNEGTALKSWTAGEIAAELGYRSECTTHAIDWASSAGHLDIVQWLDANRSEGCTSAALHGAAVSGHVDVMSWLLDHRSDDVEFSMGTFYNAAEHGQLRVVQWFVSHGYYQRPDGLNAEYPLDGAAKNNHMATVEWLHAQGDDASRGAMDLAAENGHLAMVQWLHAHRREGCSIDAMNWAANCGHLDVIQWLHTHRTEGCTTNAVDFAAENGFLTTVQWLLHHRTEGCTTQAMDLAAKNNHMDVVQWLHHHGPVGCTTAAMDGAAKGGHVGMLQWLHTHRHEGCSTNAMDFAAKKGHLDVLEWLHAHVPAVGCTTDAMDFAAQYNRLEALQWLHQHRQEGCTADAMTFAAEYGHLRIVQWLHDHRPEGCTVDAMDWSAKNGHLDVVEWLHLNRTEGCSPDVVDTVLRAGQLPVLQWWYAHRPERSTSNAMAIAAENGHLDMVQWLHNVGETCTTKAMDLAAENGHLDVIEWLHVHRDEGCSREAMDLAAENGHVHVLQWLQDHRTEGCTREALELAIAEGQVKAARWLVTHQPSKASVAKCMAFAKMYGFEDLRDWCVKFTMTTAVKKYRYIRSDFEPLETKPVHFDMVFDVSEKEVRVTLQTTLKYVGAAPKSVLKLNSKALEIVSVERLHNFTPLNGSRNFVSHVASFGAPKPLEYVVDTVDHFLVITLDTPVQSGDEFVVRTVSIARPTENILEGLYYDYTPEGAPRTIITQCQQYGFQRIVPCIDTMDAKAFYTTTIVADKNYTNIITNGDLAPGFSTPEGTPIYHDASEFLATADSTRHALKYYNHTINMAPYLFFLGVGTYVTYRRTLEFPDGDTTLLELLAFPGFAEPADAKLSVQMLHDSILWTNVSLGPESTDHHDERVAIYALLEEREAIKAKSAPLTVGSEEVVQPTPLSAADAARLAAVRAELKTLIGKWTKTGYKYTGQIYREIGMENSNYGGMENVGNTTIVSSCLCPTCRMGDHGYEYMERVKVHEYYHNINGSEVTGQSPFEIWLNEAVTVHMERKRHAAIFGQEYHRLGDVVRMFTPTIGPIALDKAATCLSVEPEGFNQTQELVSAVTYSKAPEIVRMVELLLGFKKFNVALDKYYTKYLYGNATTAEWFACMEEVSGIDFQNFQRVWLKRPDHPEVTYTTAYDSAKQTYNVKLTQTGFERFDNTDAAGPWEIPIDYALIKDGKIVREGVYFFKSKSDEFTLDNITSTPDYLSFGRQWSYFGTSKALNATNEALIKQAINDPDAVNRYFAYRAIADGEKARIVEALIGGRNDVTISPAFTALHGSILFDETLNPAVRALILSEKNALTTREDLSHHYDHITTATVALLQSVWAAHGEKIDAKLKALIKASVPGPHKDQLLERKLKQHLLAIVGVSTAPLALPTVAASSVTIDVAAVALSILNTSTFVSDKELAFRTILSTEAYADRAAVQTRIRDEWSKTPEMLEAYIATIGSLSTSDFTTQIRTLMALPYFNINQTHHTRTLARGLSQIRHKSVLTEEGRALMLELFTKIGTVNQMSAYPLLKCFDQVDAFTGATKDALVKTLQAMQDSIDKVKEESLYNQLNIMLKKA